MYVPTMNLNPDTNTSNRQAAIHGLAITGFVALIALGMWFAVYTAQYVPVAVSRLTAAAVTLSQVFTLAPDAPEIENPNGTTATSTTNGTNTATTTTATSTTNTKPDGSTVKTTAGTQTSTTTRISGTGTSTLTGLPDLAITIDAVGYLATTSAESFVASSTVPKGSRPAVQFTIKNVGTNATGSWNFTAKIPTSTNFLFIAPAQQNLNPNESIAYTLGFDQATTGANKEIVISIDPSGLVSESSTENNTASTTVTVLGT